METDNVTSNQNTEGNNADSKNMEKSKDSESEEKDLNEADEADAKSGKTTGESGHGNEENHVKLGSDVDIIDNTECKFNVNSFKLVYVVNSESFLYKRKALIKAREVCTANMGNHYICLFRLLFILYFSVVVIYH